MRFTLNPAALVVANGAPNRTSETFIDKTLGRGGVESTVIKGTYAPAVTITPSAGSNETVRFSFTSAVASPKPLSMLADAAQAACPESVVV